MTESMMDTAVAVAVVLTILEVGIVAAIILFIWYLVKE